MPVLRGSRSSRGCPALRKTCSFRQFSALGTNVKFQGFHSSVVPFLSSDIFSPNPLTSSMPWTAPLRLDGTACIFDPSGVLIFSNLFGIRYPSAGTRHGEVGGRDFAALAQGRWRCESCPGRHFSQPRLRSTIGLRYPKVLKSDGIVHGVEPTNAMNQSGFQG